MIGNLKSIGLFWLTLIFLFQFSVVTAQSGIIRGKVEEANSNIPLPGANIMIDGTNIGTASNIDGRYQLLNAPAGKLKLIFSYMGYKSDTLDVTVRENTTTMANASLVPSIIMGKEIVVTGQLQGQAAAINQQLTSENIVNVVSSDKIKQLPDNNAAESIGRLPGIAIQRSSGEAQKVFIRGLDPTYTKIMINGQVLPATSASDRSVDLSMIPSEQLEGIEVFKALTPDKPADAVAGIVNFTTRKSDPGWKGQINARTGYNRIGKEFGQTKISGNLSSRFFDDKLGVILTGSYENQPRTTQGYTISYQNAGFDPVTKEQKLKIGGLRLNHQDEIRTRFGSSLAIDYEFSSNNIIQYYTMFSKKDGNPIQYQKYYNVSDNKLQYSVDNNRYTEYQWNNSLKGESLLFNTLQMNWLLGVSSTVNDSPENYHVQFVQIGGFTAGLVSDKGPDIIPKYAKNTLSETNGGGPGASSSVSKQTDINLQVDFKYPYTISNSISGYVKGGLFYRSMHRDLGNLSWGVDGMGTLIAIDHPEYEYYAGAPTIRNFLDNDYKIENFLDGRFEFPVLIQKDYAKNRLAMYSDRFVFDRMPFLDNYDAKERISAGYVMTRLDIFDNITFIPGIRYEYTDNDYSGKFTNNLSGDHGKYGQIKDTSAVKNYDQWLPMIHLKVDLMDELTIRLAFTKTLSRPDYRELVPTTVINTDARSVRAGNGDLRETRATNYDIGVSYYSGLVGLVTINGFYKKLTDITYQQSSFILDPKSREYGFSLSMPVNALHPTEVYGFEIDLQTNLRFLPSPFDGIVVDVNYTRLYGYTYFPTLRAEVGPPPFYRTIYYPDERKGPVPGLSKHIANFSFGYEKGPFSARVSAIYQSDILTGVGTVSTSDSYQKNFIRWDAIANYKIFDRLTLYWNMNNFTSMTEDRFIYKEQFIISENHYKWTMDVGLKYDF